MDDTEEDVVMPAPPPPSSCLINKGKRTKRQRPLSPIPISAIPAGDHLMTTFSDDSTTTEEEDTARCLILLAQGRHFPTNNNNQLFPKRSSKIIRHDQETTTTTCMYECKTCNRVFRSFQALGGHRASHRKPKNDQKKPAAVFSDEEEYPFKKLRLTTTPSSNSLQLANIKPQHPSPRIHECSYCGAEFTSGQALGGHMRRHRAAGPVISSSNPVVTDPNEPKKPRNGLSLDLNLPAPDDHENQRFGFGARQQKGPVLSTSNALALVNCHY